MDVLFEMEKEYYTNQLLRNSLINFALDNNFKELFLNMSGEEWGKNLICPIKSLEYKYTAEQELVEHHDFNQKDSAAISNEEKKKNASSINDVK